MAANRPQWPIFRHRKRQLRRVSRRNMRKKIPSPHGNGIELVKRKKTPRKKRRKIRRKLVPRARRKEKPRLQSNHLFSCVNDKAGCVFLRFSLRLQSNYYPGRIAKPEVAFVSINYPEAGVNEGKRTGKDKGSISPGS